MKISRLAPVVVAAIVALLAIPGCRSRKDTVQYVTGQPQATIVLDKEAAVENLASMYGPWTDFQCPVTLSLNEPKSASFSGRATMVRGECIHLSFRFLGMEVAAIYVDSDSLYAVDKYHGYIFTESLSGLTANTGLNITDVQDVLLGRAFFPGKGTLALDLLKYFRTGPDNEAITLVPAQKYLNDDVRWWFTVSPQPAVAALTVAIPDKPLGIVRYFAPVSSGNAGQMCSALMLSASLNGKDFVGGLVWKLGSAKWDTGKTINWQMPSDYKRLQRSDIEKMLKF